MNERARLSALSRFVPLLEADDFVPGQWHKSEPLADGSWTMPWYELGETALDFVRAVGVAGWMRPGFDWPTWARTPEARALHDDREALAAATPEQLAMLLTALVREDRFNEGALGQSFESGLLLAIARRAGVLEDQAMNETGPSDQMRAFGRSTIAVVEGDITRVAADAIVNAANSAFAHGGGVDGALRAAAGPELSGEMRRRYPSGTPTGSAVATDAYALPARWVIHAVGPVWGAGDQDKLDLLASAYRSVLQLADELRARTISTPAISAGTFGFPVDTAADVALRTVRDHLTGETGIERVTFVLRPGGFEAFRRRLATI